MKGLLTLVLLAPLSLFSQSVFDGTWREDPESMQYVGHDNFSLQNGVYLCSSCDPRIEVKADGQDHKVSGSPYFDTINVREADDHTVTITNKKGGKVSGTTTRAASMDGRTLITEWTFISESGQELNGKFNSDRVGDAGAGGNKISGSWQPRKIENVSENVLQVTFKATDDGLSMTDLTGDSYNAKFDGKDYPYRGDPGTTSVSLKKIDANTIEETDKRNGKPISVTRMTVESDGKTMNVNVEDKLRNVTMKWSAKKQ